MTTEYRTSDIVLAACLRLHDVRLDRIEIVGTRGIFIFTDVPEDFTRAFDAGEVRVEPTSFNNEIRTINKAIRRLVDNG
jgi:HAMP domain-containing protein